MKELYVSGRLLCGAIIGLGACSSANAALGLFDWQSPPQPIKAGLEKYYIPLPELSDKTASVVDQIIGQRRAANRWSDVAVKVSTNITSPAAKAIFDKYRIDYVFADFETPDANARMAALAKIINTSKKSSYNFLSNFNLYPVNNDPTRPKGAPTSKAQSFKNVYQKVDFNKSYAKMASPSLYPGSPDFITPTSSSSVRQALFTLPVKRLSINTDAVATVKNLNRNVPYVARFNNWGNGALDTDKNSNKGTYAKYEFVSNASKPADGQLLSRGDFSASMLHFRMRGADTAVLFEPGVVNYTKQQAQEDMVKGWTLPDPAKIFDDLNHHIATTATKLVIDDKNQDIDQTGVVWSGVYNSSSLNILLSNLDTKNHHVDFPKISGFDVVDYRSKIGLDDAAIEAGMHRLLQYSLVQADKNHKVWKLVSNTPVFTDNNRNGVGIPEPSTAAVLGLCGSFAVAAQRRRRKA